MSDKLVKGKDVIVYIYESATNYNIICSKSCTFNRVYDVIETTSYASTAKEFETGMYEWSVSFDGILTTDVLTAGDKTAFDFVLEAGKKTVKVVMTDPNGTAKTITGDVIFPDISITGDVSDFAGYSFTAKGTGALTIS